AVPRTTPGTSMPSLPGSPTILDYDRQPLNPMTIGHCESLRAARAHVSKNSDFKMHTRPDEWENDPVIVRRNVLVPRISRRMFVAAPPEEVWELANRFDKWHPKLRETPGGPEMDPELVVKIITCDEQAMELAYTMPEPPFP